MNFSIKKLKPFFWIGTILTALYVSLILHTTIPLFNYMGITGQVNSPFSNDDSNLIVYVLFSILIIPFLITKNKLMFVMLISTVTIIQIPFINVSNARLSAMKLRYERLIINEPTYANTENSKKLLVAIKDNNPDEFIKILENTADNKKIDDASANNLLSIVLDVMPEYKPQLKVMLSDNYLTINEYNSIKKDILATITKKDLNSEQIAMIGVLK